MATAIYLVTDPQQIASFPQLKERLEKQYNVVQSAFWRLEHALLRSTPNGPESKNLPRSQHVLWLSKYNDRFFSAVQLPPKNGKKEPGPIAIVSMPSQQREQWYTLLTQKMAALWTRTGFMTVSNGFAYDVGEFTVRIGELRQPGNAQAPPKALVVCIQFTLPTTREGVTGDESTKTRGLAPEDASASEVQEVMREFWKSFGVEEAKEAFAFTRSPDGQDEARLWCDVLRHRP